MIEGTRMVPILKEVICTIKEKGKKNQKKKRLTLTLKPAENFWGMHVYTIWEHMVTLVGGTEFLQPTTTHLLKVCSLDYLEKVK